MGKIRDIVTGSLLALGVISSFAMASQPAQAVTLTPAGSESIIPASQITIDYNRCLMQVETKDDEVLVAFPTVKVEDDEIVDMKIKSWDVYTDEYKPEDSNVVTVDLSCLKTTKDSYVAVKTNATAKAILIHFRPTATKLKMTYDAEEQRLYAIDRADGDSEYDGYFEYRTVNSGCTFYDYEDEVLLKQFIHEGATLYVRELAGYIEDEGDRKILYTDGKLDSRYIAEKAGVLSIAPEYVVYDAVACFAGKELKVKIPKMASAPTASVNYNKRTFKVKKGCEYRTDTQASFTLAGDKGTEVKVGSEAGVLEVRKAAKSTKGKYTPESNVMRYEYPATREIKISNDESENSVVGKAADNLQILYDAKKQKVEFINSGTENTYLIYAAVNSAVPAPAAGDKVLLTVKPAKSAAVPTMASTNVKNLPAGTAIYVAYASVKKTKQWATEPVLLGTVK